MKTDKWRPIILKDPRLRRARKNLRTLLNLAVNAELDRISSLERLYLKKRINGRLTRSQKRRESMLIRASNELMSAKSHSILKCSTGTGCRTSIERKMPTYEISLDVDMAWNPIVKRWYCIACYNDQFGTKKAQMSFKRAMERSKRQEEAVDRKFGLEPPLVEEKEPFYKNYIAKSYRKR